MPSCTSAQLGGDGEQVRANGAGLGAPQPPARIPRATPRARLDFLGVIFRAVPDLLLPCRSCLPTQVASLDGPQLAPEKAAGEPAAVQGPRRCWRRLGGRRAAGDDFFDLAASAPTSAAARAAAARRRRRRERQGGSGRCRLGLGGGPWSRRGREARRAHNLGAVLSAQPRDFTAKIGVNKVVHSIGLNSERPNGAPNSSSDNP